MSDESLSTPMCVNCGHLFEQWPPDTPHFPAGCIKHLRDALAAERKAHEETRKTCDELRADRDYWLQLGRTVHVKRSDIHALATAFADAEARGYRRGIEDAAAVCDGVINQSCTKATWFNYPTGSTPTSAHVSRGVIAGAKRCLSQIRALADTKEDEPRCTVYKDPCPVHDFVHGAEAEELRAGLERIFGDSDAETADDVFAQIIRLLDAVDARDSLAYRETKEDEHG